MTIDADMSPHFVFNTNQTQLDAMQQDVYRVPELPVDDQNLTMVLSWTGPLSFLCWGKIGKLRKREPWVSSRLEQLRNHANPISISHKNAKAQKSARAKMVKLGYPPQIIQNSKTMLNPPQYLTKVQKLRTQLEHKNAHSLDSHSV